MRTVTEPKRFRYPRARSLSLGPPAPLRIDRPKRDMREDYNWRVRAKTFYIIFEPLELLVAKLAQTAGLEDSRTLTSPMKWTPFLLKLYQPEPLRFDALQVSLTVKFPPSLSTSCSPGT